MRYAWLFIVLAACGPVAKEPPAPPVRIDTSSPVLPQTDTVVKAIELDTTHSLDVVSFAETLIGTPYKYAGTSPTEGFDCSGFITFVFNHFDRRVPRSSIDFTNVGEEIALLSAVRGDLILFTGTNHLERNVGHMGIITSIDSGKVHFIHSTSGKQYGVTITPLNDYYMRRFVKVIRYEGEPLLNSETK